MGLDTVEIVMHVENMFSINILDREAAQLATVGQLNHYVVEPIPKQSSLKLSPEDIYSMLTDIISYRLGVLPKDVTPTHFVDDLGADQQC